MQQDSIIQDIFNLTQLVIKRDNFIGHPFNTMTCGMIKTECSWLIYIILSQLL